jgi:hypothetical protein
MQYEVKYGQSIYDVAVLLYGDAQMSIKLCIDNSIDITTDIYGMVLTYDETIKAQQIVNNTQKTYVQVPIDNTYFIKQLQSNYDLCLQFAYGLDNYATFLNDTLLTADIVENYSQNISVTKQPSNLPNVIFATGLNTQEVIPPPPSNRIFDFTFDISFN